MKVWLTYAALACFVVSVYSNCCKDRAPTNNCLYWIQDKPFKLCTQQVSKIYCKKSCGWCKGNSDDCTDNHVCNDYGGTVSCLSSTKIGFCKNPISQVFCEKTCGWCKETCGRGATCGCSTVPQSRIINGADSLPGSWPWIASLIGRSKLSHFCGGTLVSPNWVLTAGHCVDRIKPQHLHMYNVQLGANDLHLTEASVQRIRMKRIVIHPKYSRRTLYADIAMIELERPALLNSMVNLPCMPQKGVYPQIGKQCYLAGWGAIEHPGGAHHKLQQVKLPVVSKSECGSNEAVCVGKGRGLTRDGKQQPNACKGDSGGPLVCQQADGRWQLEGVTSFVVTFCKYYTGYSPVNKYLGWINSYINAP